MARVPSIKSMDTGNNVIYMYSFSLTMIPGIGLSFIVADRNIIERLSKLISVRMVTLDWASQVLVLECMREGLFYKRLEIFRQICREKRDLMCRYLDDMAMEFDLEYKKPDGGVYIWVKLPEGIDSRILLDEAQKEGVTFIPGHVFYPQRFVGYNYIRLNYSYPLKSEIESGMDKLGNILKKHK